MRIVQTKELQEALAVAALFSASHSPMEHYLSCRVKTVKDGVSLLCMSSVGVCQTKATSDGEDVFQAYVPVKRLRDVLANIPDEVVGLSVSGSSLVIATEIGDVSVSASNFEFQPPTITEGDWVDVNSKASSDELAFLASVSSLPAIDCVSIIGNRGTTCTNTSFAWVEGTSLSWCSGSLLGMESAKLLRSLLSKAENASVLADKGNLGIQWDNGVALIRGVDFAGKVRTIPSAFFSNSKGVAVCEVERASLQHVLGLCQGISLVESTAVRITAKDGSLRVTKETSGTGAVDMSIRCTTFHRPCSWYVDINVVSGAVKAVGTEVICLDGYATFADEPDDLTLVVNDQRRFVAVGGLQE